MSKTTYATMYNAQLDLRKKIYLATKIYILYIIILLLFFRLVENCLI